MYRNRVTFAYATIFVIFKRKLKETKLQMVRTSISLLSLTTCEKHAWRLCWWQVHAQTSGTTRKYSVLSIDYWAHFINFFTIIATCFYLLLCLYLVMSYSPIHFATLAYSDTLCNACNLRYTLQCLKLQDPQTNKE